MNCTWIVFPSGCEVNRSVVMQRPRDGAIASLSAA
jgi:hypothetical protein